MEWQPIDTAPKDQSVLLTDGVHVTYGAFCDDPRQYWWLADEGIDGLDFETFEPTHWMPRPAPPPADP